MSMRCLTILLAIGALLLGGGLLQAQTPLTRVYPVADLVVPLGEQGKPMKTTEQQLIKLIESTIAPDSWTCRGGKGTITYFPLTMSLVAAQTPAVHTEIKELLAQLRKLMDVQVSLEMRFVTVSPAMYDKLGLDTPQKDSVPGLAYLDDTQVRVLLETVQSDPQSNVMAAPKVTMFNGQKANLNITDNQSYITGVEISEEAGKKHFKPKTKTFKSGLQTALQTVIAQDRRSVQLQLSIQFGQMFSSELKETQSKLKTQMDSLPVDQANLESLRESIQTPRVHMISLEKTLKIQTGTTALLTGWTYQKEVRHEQFPPALQRIPYLNRLFSSPTMRMRTEHLLVLVTPRIIVQKEDEEKLPVNDTDQVLRGAGQAFRMDPVVATTTTGSMSVPIAHEQNLLPADKVTYPPQVDCKVLYVRKKEFEITYPLEHIAKTKLRSVELWWTSDGRQWERYPEEIKPTGKIPVIVKREGTWGFCVVPRSESGVLGAPPRTGDQPLVRVVVDLTPPSIETFLVSKNEYDSTGRIRFHWKASDNNLAEHPITLKCASSESGPWTTLGTTLPTAGTNVFSSSEFPHMSFFKIEATDKAGNVTSKIVLMASDITRPLVTDVMINPPK